MQKNLFYHYSENPLLLQQQLLLHAQGNTLASAACLAALGEFWLCAFARISAGSKNSAAVAYVL